MQIITVKIFAFITKVSYLYIYIYMKGLDFHFKQCWSIIRANPTAEVEKAKQNIKNTSLKSEVTRPVRTA